MSEFNIGKIEMSDITVSWDEPKVNSIMSDLNDVIDIVKQQTYKRIYIDTLKQINPALAYRLMANKWVRFQRHYTQAGPWADMIREG